jgi:hypothetical protein
MRLSECRFYYSGEELNFSIFSDGVFRAKHVDSFVMRLMGNLQVDVYEIAPPAAGRWLVVRQTNGEEITYKWFVREHEAFLEKEDGEVSNQVRSEVLHRFPQLAEPMPWAA